MLYVYKMYIFPPSPSFEKLIYSLKWANWVVQLGLFLSFTEEMLSFVTAERADCRVVDRPEIFLSWMPFFYFPPLDPDQYQSWAMYYALIEDNPAIAHTAADSEAAFAALCGGIDFCIYDHSDKSCVYNPSAGMTYFLTTRITRLILIRFGHERVRGRSSGAGRVDAPEGVCARCAGRRTALAPQSRAWLGLAGDALAAGAFAAVAATRMGVSRRADAAPVRAAPQRVDFGGRLGRGASARCLLGVFSLYSEH
jgi:hypothetical protein